MEPTMEGRGKTRPRAFLIVLLFALGLLSAAPSASAESGKFAYAEISLSPETFRAELYQESREGSAAERFREIVDEEHGNADGEVTEDEVDAYREAIKTDFNNKLANPFAKALVADFQVNERPPREVRVTDIRVTPNVLGPVTDNSTIYRDIFAQMNYPSTSRDRANVSFANDFRQAFVGLEWGYAVFSGDAPWAIDPDTIDPSGVRERFWTGDGFNVTYAETPEFASGFEPLSFQLENASVTADAKATKKDSPGLGTPLALVVIGLVALLRRRR